MFLLGSIKTKKYRIAFLFKHVIINFAFFFSCFIPAELPERSLPPFPEDINHLDVESKTIFIKLRHEPLWQKAFLHDLDLKKPLIKTTEPYKSLFDHPVYKLIEKTDGLMYQILLHPEGSTLYSNSYKDKTLQKIFQPIESMIFSQDRSIFILEFGNGELVLSEKGFDFQESTKPIRIFETFNDSIIQEWQIEINENRHPQIIEKIRLGQIVEQTTMGYTQYIEKQFSHLESNIQFEKWARKVQDLSDKLKIAEKSETKNRFSKFLNIVQSKIIQTPTPSKEKSSETTNRINGTQIENTEEVKEKSTIPSMDSVINRVPANNLEELLSYSKEQMRDTSWRRAFGRGAVRFVPQAGLFYLAVGTLSFTQSLTDPLLIGAQSDPLWKSNFIKETFSPLGISSFAGFVAASSVVDAVITQKWIIGGAHIKYEKKLAKLRKEYLLNFNNPKNNFYQLSGEIEKLKGKRMRRIKFGEFMKMPFALSAGMLASTTIHEFWADPNVKQCAEGMNDPSKRAVNFLDACDQAYHNWARKIAQWGPDLVSLISAGALSHAGTGYVAKKLPSSFKSKIPFPNVVGGFLNLLLFLATINVVTDPIVKNTIKIPNLKKKIKEDGSKLKDYILSLHENNMIDKYPAESCIISKEPKDMTKEEINQWLSSRTLSFFDKISLPVFSVLSGFSFRPDSFFSLGTLDSSKNQCTNNDMLEKFNNQFHLSSNLQELSFMGFHMAHNNWSNLTNKAVSSFLYIETILEQIIESNTAFILNEKSFPLHGIKLKRNSADTTDPCLTQQKGDPFLLTAFQQQYKETYLHRKYSDIFRIKNNFNDVEKIQIKNTIEQAVSCISDLLKNKDIKENKIEDLVSKESGHFLIPKSSNKRFKQTLADIRTLLECEQCDLNDPNRQESIAAGIELINRAIKDRTLNLAPSSTPLKKFKKKQKQKLLLVKNILGLSAEPFYSGADFYDKIIKYTLGLEHKHSHASAIETIWNIACGKEDLQDFDKTNLNIAKDEEVEDLVQKLPSLTKPLFSKRSYGSFYLFNMPKITNNKNLSFCEKYPSYKDLSSNQALSEIRTHIKSNIINQTQLEELNKKIEDQFLIFLDVQGKDYNNIVAHHYNPSIDKVLSNYHKEVQDLAEIITLIHTDTLEENTSTHPESSQTQACLDIGILEKEMTKENIIAISTESIKEHIQIDSIEEKSLKNLLICLQSLVGYPSNETYQIEKNKIISEDEDANDDADWWIDRQKGENRASCLNRLDDGICNFTKFSLRDQASIVVYRRLRSIVNDVSNLKAQRDFISNRKTDFQSSNENSEVLDSPTLLLIRNFLNEELIIELLLDDNISIEQAIQHILNNLSSEDKEKIQQLLEHKINLENAIQQYLLAYLEDINSFFQELEDTLKKAFTKAQTEKNTMELLLNEEINIEEATQHILNNVTSEEKETIQLFLGDEISLEEVIQQNIEQHLNLIHFNNQLLDLAENAE